MMLSRVVDSLYWMSRYLERAEHIARLLDVHTIMMLDVAPDSDEQHQFLHLWESLAVSRPEPDDVDGVLRELTFSTEGPISILLNITNARENARQVREQLSSEMWMRLNSLYLHVKQAGMRAVWIDSPHDFYQTVIEGAQLFQGVTDATMNHNEGWHFIQIGRYLERIMNLQQLLKAHFGSVRLDSMDSQTSERYVQLVSTLKSMTAFEAYCKVYSPNLQSAWITEFLLFNPDFPHSARFGVDQILVSIHALAEATGRQERDRLHRTVGRLQSSLSFDDIADVHARNLITYLDSIKEQVFAIHDMLYNTYITYPIGAELK